jgi:hypothetical protein
MYGLRLERRIFYNILYEVDSSDISENYYSTKTTTDRKTVTATYYQQFEKWPFLETLAFLQSTHELKALLLNDFKTWHADTCPGKTGSIVKSSLNS